MIRRWKDHCWHSKRGSTYVFHNSIRKHGKEAWTHEILESHETIEEVKLAEIRLIAEHQTFFYDHPDKGYNMTRGGDGVRNFGELNHFFGKKHTEATRAIIKEKRAEQVMNPCSAEKALKISQSNLKTFEKLKATGATRQRAINSWKSRRANLEKPHLMMRKHKN